MSKVTVYSKTEFCGQCMATERALLNKGIEFEEELLQNVDSAQIETWRTEVGSTAPIVVTDTELGPWSGFRPDKIEALGEGR